MLQPLVGSTNPAQLTVEDAQARVTTATVRLTLRRPDAQGGQATVTDLLVPHVGNGVYQVLLPPSAFPVAGAGYEATWHITAGAYDVTVVTTHTAVVS